MAEFDPYDHPDPQQALTLLLRGMPIGHDVHLLDGTVIKSIPMKHGATHVRRFVVSSQGAAVPRIGTRQNSHATAAEAASAALKNTKL